MSTKIILHVTGMKSTKYGGIERYFVELSKSCAQKGYQSVFQFESRPRTNTYLRDLTDLRSTIEIIRTDGQLFSVATRITALLRRVRAEIVHVHWADKYTLSLTPLIARVMGVKKCIITVHGMVDLHRFSLSTFGYNRYDHAIGVSHAVSASLLEGGVKPNIVSTQYLGLFGHRERSKQLRREFRRELDISDEKLVLACIAFDAPVKGLDILLHALAKVIQKHPLVYLVVMGVNSSRSALLGQASDLGLAERVRWAGIRDEAWRILNVADLYVQPSRSEALGFAVIEAMALKMPVVATRVGGLPEAVIDNVTGYLSDPENIDSLAKTLERALAEQNKWETLGNAGHLRYLRLFNGKDSVNAIMNNYYQLDTERN